MRDLERLLSTRRICFQTYKSDVKIHHIFLLQTNPWCQSSATPGLIKTTQLKCCDCFLETPPPSLRPCSKSWSLKSPQRKHPDGVDPQAGAALRLCWADGPEDRWPTADELATLRDFWSLPFLGSDTSVNRSSCRVHFLPSWEALQV